MPSEEVDNPMATPATTMPVIMIRAVEPTSCAYVAMQHLSCAGGVGKLLQLLAQFILDCIQFGQEPGVLIHVAGRGPKK